MWAAWSSPADRTARFDLKCAGSGFVVKDATFPATRQGKMRAQAAVQGPDGRHGAVTISNVVPFRTTCAGK